MTPIKPHGYLPSRLPAACRRAARYSLLCWRAHRLDNPVDLLERLTPRQRQVLRLLGLRRKSELVQRGPLLISSPRR